MAHVMDYYQGLADTFKERAANYDKLKQGIGIDKDCRITLTNFIFLCPHTHKSIFNPSQYIQIRH